MVKAQITTIARHLKRNGNIGSMGLVALLALCLNTIALHADEIEISDKSVRVLGYYAEDFVETMRKHNMIPEDIKVLAPEDPGDTTTEFIMLRGWESLDNIGGAREVCDSVCDDLDNKIQIVSVARVVGDQVVKWVFIDLNQLADGSNFTGSLGYSGCIADQLFQETRMVKP